LWDAKQHGGHAKNLFNYATGVGIVLLYAIILTAGMATVRVDTALADITPVN
jgi:hypothetical protein